MRLGDLNDGQGFDLVVVVREREGSQAVLADASGTVAGRLPEDVCVQAGAIVRVRGEVVAGTLVVESLRVEGPSGSPEQMEADLRELIATVQCEHLRALLEAVFAPGTQTWEQYRTAPAAKRYHHPYRHGLLEHSLTVAQGVSAMAATFGGIDRDVAVTGALLHDIGKLDAYTSDPLAIELTDLGKLQGEIPLGYYRVRRLIEDLPGFPERTAAAVLHIILSHHGTHEHGSPVLPCTREATLVHMIDNLGGRLGSFDRLEKDLPEGAQWSGFDRALSGAAWFAPRVAA
jgi:3'-5' exoribonuclease